MLCRFYLNQEIEMIKPSKTQTAWSDLDTD